MADHLSLLLAHEHSGDLARDHSLFEDAAQHYRDALLLEGIADDDRLRISEKLAYALSFGRNPHEAAPLFERALERYIEEPAEAAKTVEILLQRARDLWRDARTIDAIPLLGQAVEVAKADGSARLRVLATSRMADYLIGLDRYPEAARLVAEVSELLDDSDAASGATYNVQRGLLACERGDTTETIQAFERALHLAQQTAADLGNIPQIWSAYAASVISLGETELAISASQRGMLFAREHHIISAIPLLCVGHARLLMLTGQYGVARRHLAEALSYEVEMPRMEIHLARTGTRLGLYLNDEQLLERCTKPSALMFALRTGQPDMIGDTAAAFAEWHVRMGRPRQARELLHLAVDRLQIVTWYWGPLVTAARHGLESDLPKARQLIASRVERPSSDVPRACLSLFDAYVAKRSGAVPEAFAHAREAVRRFSALGWHGVAETARAILDSPRAELISTTRVPSDARLISLTVRERQIAELVFAGYSNGDIAQLLAISRRTVEAHMTSILHRLGIRSRYQLERFA